MSFATFVDWIIARFKIIGAAAPPSVTGLVQLVVSGSDTEL